MPTRDETFPSRWLKASDVETPVVVTIDKCQEQIIGQGAKAAKKPVLMFLGTTKPHILNQTNWDSMVNISGYANSDDWGGTTIELYSVDVIGPNGPTRGVRIRRASTRHATMKRGARAVPAPAPKVDPDDPLPGADEGVF